MTTTGAAQAGVHLLRLPTPFPVGTVNAYLIEAEALTLVDTGLGTWATYARLEQLLGERGYAIEDLDRILLTHEHHDHAGLADPLSTRSGARVACLAALAPYLEDYATEAVAVDEHDARELMRQGVPEGVALAVDGGSLYIRGYGGPTTVHDRFADGEILDLGNRSLRVAHRPGHTPSDTIFVDDERRIAIVGDHLLAAVSSNAVLTRPLDPAQRDQRRRPLLEYRRSLEATRDEPVDVLFTGHGPPITDHQALVTRRLREQERFADKLRPLLQDGPRTAHELAREVYGRRAFTQVLLTVSEIVGHLDLLIEAGAAAEDGDGAIVRFRLV